MQQVDLTWGVASHRGQRAENQDCCLAEAPVFAVADGMGGHAAGGQASELAVRHLAAVAGGPTVNLDALRLALRHADEAIRRLSEGTSEPGAGTTVAGVAMLENGGELYWAAFHVGDSRIYRWSAAAWERVSTDHSVVQELLDDGSISLAEAVVHPQRHVITRALGVGPQREADYTLLPVRGQERLLMCSDGLTGVVADDRLLELLAADRSAADIAQGLVAEAVERGATDNVSVVVVQVHGFAGAHPAADDPEEVTVPRLGRNGDMAATP
jgi:protein phosphatase